MAAVTTEYFQPIHLKHFGRAQRIERGIKIRAVNDDSMYEPLVVDGEELQELSHAVVIVSIPRGIPIRGEEPLGTTLPNRDGEVKRIYRLRRVVGRPELANLEVINRHGIRIELTESTETDTRLRIIYPSQQE